MEARKISQEPRKYSSSFKRKIKGKLSIAPYIVPSFVFLFILFASLVSCFNYSINLSDLTIPGSENVFVGMKNYIIVMTSSIFQNSFMISIFYSLISPPLSIFLGFAIALLITKYCRRGLPIFRTIFVIPPMIAPIVVSYMWLLVFMSTETGYLNYFLKNFLGLPTIDFFARPWWARIILLFVWQWSGIPFQFLVFTAAILSIPQTLYESAEIDGASSVNTFRHITLPLLKPLIITLLLLGIISGLLGGFDAVFVITKGGPYRYTDLLGFRAYIHGFMYNHMGEATALCVLMTVIVVVYVIGALREHMRAQW